MLLDVLHLLHSFIIPELPEDYEDFKTLSNGMFPNVVDTKVMATNLPFKELISDHSLGMMLQGKNVESMVNVHVYVFGLTI